MRVTRSFWRAAFVSSLFVAAQHTLLLLELPLPVALAALLVAVATSFPLAHVFELSGGSILGAAMIHAVIQGTPKIVVLPEPYLMPMQLAWMAASVVVPYLVFLIWRRKR